MTKSDTLFIIFCILVVITAIVWSIASVFIYKKEQAIKNPYYFCDATWQCCSSDNCDTNKSISGEGISKDAIFEYPADNWKPGSLYHQNCVLPVQNAILNYESTPNAKFDVGFIYLGGPKPETTPSVYYPGCTGPGVTGGIGDCNNPELNPHYNVEGGHNPEDIPCPYVSFDSGGNGSRTNNKLATGTTYAYNGGATLSPPNWANNKASPYIAGTNSGDLGPNNAPGNTYQFPYKTKYSNKNQYTGGGSVTNPTFTKSNTHLNTFYDLKTTQYIGVGVNAWKNPSLTS